MKIFKTIQGDSVDVVKHTLSILNQYPLTEVFIGTDSQNMRKKTIYCTVIAFRYGFRGVHYIYHKEVVDEVKNTFLRLWGETDRSLEVAQWFTAQINVPITIDMDFNEDEHFESNKLIASSTGWALSLGFDVNTKPNMVLACKAADHHCRSGKPPRRKKRRKT